MSDETIEIVVRQARMEAAKADPARSASGIVAALAAGMGAELVARQHRAREALTMRIEKARRARETRK